MVHPYCDNILSKCLIRNPNLLSIISKLANLGRPRRPSGTWTSAQAARDCPSLDLSTPQLTERESDGELCGEHFQEAEFLAQIFGFVIFIFLASDHVHKTSKEILI